MTMSIIKSYTDIEQSKVLAEILPLESADNVIVSFGDRDGVKTIVMPFETLNAIRTPFSDVKKVIPCWSLAALLEEMPEVINFEDDESDYVLKIEIEGGLYWLSYGNVLEYGKLEIEPQENFVDACVSMIEKLNERKML